MNVRTHPLSILLHVIIVVLFLALGVSITASEVAPIPEPEVFEFENVVPGYSIECGEHSYEANQMFPFDQPFIWVDPDTEVDRRQIEVPHKNGGDGYLVESQFVACTLDDRLVVKVMDYLYKMDLTRSNQTLYLFDQETSEFSQLSDPTFEVDRSGFIKVVASEANPGVLFGHDFRPIPNDKMQSSGSWIRRIVAMTDSGIEWSTDLPFDNRVDDLRFTSETEGVLEILVTWPSHRGMIPLGEELAIGHDMQRIEYTVRAEDYPPLPIVITLDALTGEILEEAELELEPEVTEGPERRMPDRLVDQIRNKPGGGF